MPLPAFRSVGTAAESTAAITPGLPAGIQANDVMIMVIEAVNTQTTDPAGWTEVLNSPSTIGGAAANPTSLSVKYRRVVDPATETAPTIADRGDHAYGVIAAFSGVVTTGDPWDVSAVTQFIDSTATSIAGPAVTTTVADCLILDLRTDSRDVAGARWSGTPSNANLTNLTERFDGGTAIGHGGGIGIVDGGKATAGNTGQTTITYFTNVAASKIVMTLALRPASATIGGSAIVAGGGTILASVLKGALGLATLLGGGSIASTGLKGAAAAVTLSGGGSITATGRKGLTASVTVPGGGTTAATGFKGQVASPTVSGGGTVTASGSSTSESETHSGSTTLSGGGAITAAGAKGQSSTASISAGGLLVVTGTKGGRGAIILSGAGSITSLGRKAAIGVASTLGGGSIIAVGQFNFPILVLSPTSVTLVNPSMTLVEVLDFMNRVSVVPSMNKASIIQNQQEAEVVPNFTYADVV